MKIAQCLGSEAQLKGCGVRRLGFTEKQRILKGMFHPCKNYVFSESLSNAAQLKGCGVRRLSSLEKEVRGEYK